MGIEEDFSAAYDRVLAQWPVPVEEVDLPSAYGTTRVTSCGPEGGPPLVLLPGGGATSTVWFASAAELSRDRRLHAVDLICDAGRSVPSGQPIDSAGDLYGWLDTVLDAVGGGAAVDLGGHSYGGWIALTYALRSPSRVRRLALLDPTRCFAGFAPRYLLHAAPALLRPSAERTRRLLRWEAGDRQLDAAWLELAGLATERPGGKVISGPRPAADGLRAFEVPTLVLLAERSQAHDVGRVGATARQLLPKVKTAVVPGVSHHSMPVDAAGGAGRETAAFLR